MYRSRLSVAHYSVAIVCVVRVVCGS
eukprot:COSAG04_NODE_31052_length_259_cov_0.625000_1_plen_25_part_10